MNAEIVRREFDTALELVTPPVPPEGYLHETGGVYSRLDGAEYRYDAYLPAADGPLPPVVVFVHGDGPPDFLREPRLWGQYRSWAALTASRGMAAITFDHASSEGRTRMASVVAQIEQLLDLIGERADDLGVDAQRLAVWSGSAGVPFGFVASIGRPNVRCQVAFWPSSGPGPLGSPRSPRGRRPRPSTGARRLHVATETGILHGLRKAAPNTRRSRLRVRDSLRDWRFEVPAIRARRSLCPMLFPICPSRLRVLAIVGAP